MCFLGEVTEEQKEEAINSKNKFDIIVIDGAYRRECAKKAIGYLKNDGF